MGLACACTKLCISEQACCASTTNPFPKTQSNTHSSTTHICESFRKHKNKITTYPMVCHSGRQGIRYLLIDTLKTLLHMTVNFLGCVAVSDTAILPIKVLENKKISCIGKRVFVINKNNKPTKCTNFLHSQHTL